MAGSSKDYWQRYKPDIQRALEDKRRKHEGKVRLKDLTEQGYGGKHDDPRDDLYCHFNVAFGEDMPNLSGRAHANALLIVLWPLLKSGDRMTVEIAHQDGEDLLKVS